MSAPLTHPRLLAYTYWRKISRHWPGLLLVCLLSALPIVIRSVAPPRVRAEKASRELLASLNEAVSVRAVARGNPSIHLSDGHDLTTAYAGRDDLRAALEQNQAEPLSLSSADFDEDGVPDLVSGYSYNEQGIVTLLRGNVDSIYPNSSEARQRRADGTFTNAPFLSPANVFSAPASPDFIGTGDFDGDSHWDVVVASRRRDSLFLLSGDGRGNLTFTSEVHLPGAVTAMTTGEINRRDGLNDVVVGVERPEGAAVMVFEGPRGALRSNGELFPTKSTVRALALGFLDQDSFPDLAVGAGPELLILHSRDRKLSLDSDIQTHVAPPIIDRGLASADVLALAIRETFQHHRELVALSADGQLTSWSSTTDKAPEISNQSSGKPIGYWPGATQLLNVHVSTNSADDLLVVEPLKHQIEIITETVRPESPVESLVALTFATEAVAVQPMRLNSDGFSDLVTLSRDRSAVSLSVTTPASVFVVTNTNNSGAGSLRQAITDANTNPGPDTITFSIGAGVQTITSTTALPEIFDSVTIDGTTQPGFSGKPLIVLDGVNAGASVAGLNITAGSSTVRGLVIQRFGGKQSVFNPNFAYGILLELKGNNIIEGNFIGTDQTGLVRKGNQTGIAIDEDSSGNTVGGTVPAARNVISGAYSASGVILISDQNVVQGNFLGLDVGGANAIENDGNGIFVKGSNNTVGGTAAGARNVIAGNVIPDLAIARSGTASKGNLVQGNFIGTDVTGLRAIRNNTTEVFQRTGLILGGADQALAADNLIGGTTDAARNIISGHLNGGIGVFNNGTTNNLVQGNFIGLDSTGNSPLGNSVGVLATDAPGNTIGGAVVEARNIVAGNTIDGIELGPFNFVTKSIGGSGVTLQGNYIGTNAMGSVCIGNGRDGVFVELESLIHTVKENLVGCNGRNGVNVPNVTENSGNPAIRIFIDSNSIYDNNALGIDLGPGGITANDAGDADVGANLLQNFPVLNAADPVAAEGKQTTASESLSPSSLTIKGTLNSTPNTTFTLHWYFSSDLQCSSNESVTRPLAFGKIPGVTTNGTGDANFSFPFDFPQGTKGGVINCTATDPNGNTSEFSSCFKVGGVPSASPTPTPVATPTATPTPPRPANDNFAQGQIIVGSAGDTNGTNVGATKETGEWDHVFNSGGRSVWYRWQPTASGSVTLTTASSNFDTLLAVYTGSSVNSVTKVRDNDDIGGGNLTSSVTFNAVAGTDYRIVVDGFGGISGSVGLTWNLSGGPTPTPTPAGCATLTFAPNQAIPDNAAAGINIPLSVSGFAGTISDLNIRLDGVTHTWDGDLQMKLTAPNGTSSSIFVDRPGFPASSFGCMADDFINTVLDDEAGGGSIENVCSNGMNGNFTPNNPLTSFDGLSANGIWTLNVADLAQGDTGRVQAVSLVICTNQSTPSAVQFSLAASNVNESGPTSNITVARTGDSSGEATVSFNTSDAAGSQNCNVLGGKASSRCDYETTLRTIKFAAGETSKIISIPIIDDAFAEGAEVFNLGLTDPEGISLGAQNTATVTIIDNEGANGPNPIGDATFLTRLHYFDFLSREADTAGLNFWRDQITSCGSDTVCTEVRRINVSASFFLSIEFQQTGYLVERSYKVSYGDVQRNSSVPAPLHQISVPIIRFNEFLADTQQITLGIVVLSPGWEQQLENNKVAFFNQFVQRSRFTAALPTTLTPAQFIDQLNANAGDVLSAGERTTAINLFGGAGNTTNMAARAQALRQVAEDSDLHTAEFNRAFVLMQYFGYLRRNPDDPQDTDYSGYEFWLIKLNQSGGNYINAEMVKAFLSSIEYNRRFGP
jgi:subtilisin-like proprotein convertase family protein